MKPTLLVVDDEESIHKLIQRIFSDGAIDVMSAFNGQEGLALAQQGVPQLILLDINMPVMDGYEAMRGLRRDKKTKNIPVLMFTANGEMVDRVVGFEMGVEDYITKPIDVNELRRRVMSFF